MNKTNVFMNRKARRAMAKGRIRRDESQAGGGQTGVTGLDQNNQGGNGGESSQTGNTEQNNGGQSFDPASFWSDPSSNGGGETSSQTPQQPNQQQQQQPNNYGQQLSDRIGGLNFAPAFTADAAAAIADGNLDAVNQNFTQMGREVTRQAVAMSAELMQHFGQNMLARMEQMISDSLGQRDNSQTLAEAFPEAASNPAMRPMIQGVFDQALKHAGNDRAKAVAMTRDMLKLMGQVMPRDLGINESPANRGDSFVTTGSQSLVEDLLRASI